MAISHKTEVALAGAGGAIVAVGIAAVVLMHRSKLQSATTAAVAPATTAPGPSGCPNRVLWHETADTVSLATVETAFAHAIIGQLGSTPINCSVSRISYAKQGVSGNGASYWAITSGDPAVALAQAQIRVASGTLQVHQIMKRQSAISAPTNVTVHGTPINGGTFENWSVNFTPVSGAKGYLLRYYGGTFAQPIGNHVIGKPLPSYVNVAPGSQFIQTPGWAPHNVAVAAYLDDVAGVPIGLSAYTLAQ